MVIVLLILSATWLNAANYYWVGGSGNWSDFANHWATTSGGSTFHSSEPGELDNVYFDANSFTAGGAVVTINVDATCADMNWTGVTNNPRLAGTTSRSLNIFGSLTLVAGMEQMFMGRVNFNSLSTGRTIRTAGHNFNRDVYFQGIGGWSLADELNAGSWSIYFASGTLQTNNQNVTAGRFLSATSNTRLLVLGSSTLTFTYSSSWYYAMEINGTNLSLQAGTSQIRFTGADPYFYNYNGGGLTFHDVVFEHASGSGLLYVSNGTFSHVEFKGNGTVRYGNAFTNLTFGGNGSLYNDNTIGNLTLTAGKTYMLGSGNTQTITGQLTANGNCAAPIALQSTSPGYMAYLSKLSGTIGVSYCHMSDIQASGGATFTATNSIDLGGNAGWTIHAPASLNLYWVGGSGNWNDPARWSLTSGGVAGSCIPSAVDNVFFDANSFTETGQTVTLAGIGNNRVTCRHMNWTGATNQPTLAGASNQTLYIFGSLLLNANMNYNFNGQLYFSSTTQGNNIFTAGIPLNKNRLYFQGSGAWTLMDGLNLGNQDIYFISGTLNTNNQPLTSRNFYSSTDGQRTLNLGSSTLTIANYLEIRGTNLSLNAGTSTIKLTGAGAQFYMYYSDAVLQFHNLLFEATSQTGYLSTRDCRFNSVTFNGNGHIGYSNTFGSLAFSPGFQYTLATGTTQTILNELDASGTEAQYIIIKSAYAGYQAFFSKESGDIQVEFVSLQDNNATGGANFVANNSIDMGNNTGWTINAPAGKNYYWVGGTGNWNDPARWSLTSGGTGGAGVPTLLDNVFFDSNSFPATGQTVTVVGDASSNANCNNMDWSGVTNNPTFAGAFNQNLMIYGSLTLAGNMNYTFSGRMHFMATVPGQHISSAGIALDKNELYFAGEGGEWTLLDALNTGNRDIYFQRGTLNTNDQSLTMRRFYSDNANVRTLNLGASTITITYSSSYYSAFVLHGNNLTLNAGSSLIRFTGASAYMYCISGEGFDFYDVAFEGVADNYLSVMNGSFHTASFAGNATVYRSNQFGTLTLSAGKQYVFESGATQTILDALVANGSEAEFIIIRATSAGTQASFSKESGQVVVNYVSLQDNNATGGATFVANSSLDMGNNSGWTINLPAGKNYYWVGGTGNWNDASKWSLSSGGAGGAGIPTILDNVVFDANSFTASGQTLTLVGDAASNVTCRNMDWTGVLNNPTLAGSSSQNLRIYGSLALVQQMQFNFNGKLYFEATTTGNTIITAGKVFDRNDMYFQGAGGEWTLQDDLNLGNRDIYFVQGTLVTNDRAINLRRFLSDYSNNRTLNLGASVITVSYPSYSYFGYAGFNIQGTNMTLLAGTSLIHFTADGGSLTVSSGDGLALNNVAFEGATGTSFLYAAGCSFNEVMFHGNATVNNGFTANKLTFSGNGTIYGSNTFGTLVLSPGKQYNLQNSRMQTIVDDLVANGTCSMPILIQSDSNTAQATMFKMGEGLLWMEFFNYSTGAIPPGWQLTGEQQGWQVANSFSAGGSAPELVLYDSPNITGMSRLVSKPIETKGYESLTLSFIQYLNNFSSYNNEVAAIDISFDQGATWEAIWETEVRADIPRGSYQYSFDVPQGVTELLIGFRFDGTPWNIYSWHIDDLMLTATSGKQELVGSVDKISFGTASNMEGVSTVDDEFIPADKSHEAASGRDPMRTEMTPHEDGSIVINHVSLKGINAMGGVPFIANNAIDLGNNTGWTINETSEQDLYWVGGSGNWDDVNNWSGESGGPGGYCLPTKLDNVIFDEHSFSQTGQAIFVNVANAECRNMDWTAAAYNPTFSSTSNTYNLKIYGSLWLNSEMNFAFSGDVYFLGDSIEKAGHTIDMAGSMFNKRVYFDNASGTWLLQGALAVSSDLVLSGGTLNTNNKMVNAARVVSTGTTDRKLVLGTSVISLSSTSSYAWEVTGNNLQLDAGNATIKLISSNGGFYSTGSGDLQYHAIAFENPAGSANFYSTHAFASVAFTPSGMLSGGSQIDNLLFKHTGEISGNNTLGEVMFLHDAKIRGTNTFNILKLSPGSVVLMEAGRTQTILEALEFWGSLANPIHLRSAAAGSQATISKSSDVVMGNYIFLRDMQATGGATFNVYNSQDQGNNSGWNFLEPVEASCPDNMQVCIDIAAFEMDMAHPSGGEYSGQGVFYNQAARVYMFDPGQVEGEESLITYRITDGFPSTCSFTITILPLPVAVCRDDMDVCAGSDYIALYEGTGIYTLEGEMITGFNPLEPGTFVITYSETNACGTAYCTFSIVVRPSPVLVCPGHLTFMASDSRVDLAEYVSPAGGVFTGDGVDYEDGTYWFDPAAGLGQYSVSYCASLGDCERCCTFNIYVIEPLEVAITISSADVCAGSGTRLTANATGGLGSYTYAWTSDPDGFTSTSRNPYVYPQHNTSYTVVVSDGVHETSASSGVKVFSNLPPAVPVYLTPAAGAYELNLPVQFSWEPADHAAAYDLYIWRSDQSRPAAPTHRGIRETSFQQTAYLDINYLYNWQLEAYNPCPQPRAAGPVQGFSFKPFPDLTVAGPVVPETAYSGQNLNISFQVTNAGVGGTNFSSWEDEVFLSATPDFNSATAIRLGSFGQVSDLAAGAAYTRYGSLWLEHEFEGEYYVFVRTDAKGSILEMDESNNMARSANPVTILVSPYPDLLVRDVHAISARIVPGGMFQAGWIVKNIGDKAAVGGWSQRVTIVSGSQRRLLGYLQTADSLAVDGVLSQSASFQIPNITGLEGDFRVEVLLTPNPALVEKPNAQENNLALSAEAVPMEKKLFLTIPVASIDENRSSPLQLTVSRSGATAGSMAVQLTASEAGRINIPLSVTIPAGQSAVTFPLYAIDNAIYEGNVDVTVRASALGYQPAEGKLTIIEDEMASLTVSVVPVEVIEGGVVQVTVSRSIVVNTPLLVTLNSSHPLRALPPSKITIGGGEGSATFNLYLTDNDIPEMPQLVTLSAVAENYNPGSASFTIVDNDIPSVELVIIPDTVSEGGGPYAAWGKVRRTVAGNKPIKLILSAQPGGQVYLPSQVIIPPGVMERQFNIGVVDNNLLDGTRRVEIAAAIFLESCNCAMPYEAGGVTKADLVILDNDGPALMVSADPFVVAEGLTNAGILTISRNTPPAQDLTVFIQHGSPTEIEVATSAVIPAGQSSVAVPFHTIDDGVDDGDKVVNINVSAEGYAPGTTWLMVTDRNLPDLVIADLVLPVSTAMVNEAIGIDIYVKNAGKLAAPRGAEIDVYLSDNNRIDEGDFRIFRIPVPTTIEMGETLKLSTSFSIAKHVGAKYVIAEVNKEMALTELFYHNNTSDPVELTLLPDYNATVSVQGDVFNGKTPIRIEGYVESVSQKAVSEKEVDVYLIVDGTRRVLPAVSDQQGNFFVDFVPLNGEAGQYTVGACFPGQGLKDAQDSFTILGMKYTGDPIRWNVLLEQPVEGVMPIKNFSNLPLNGIGMEIVSAPPGIELSFESPGSLSGNATAEVGYTLQAFLPSSGAYFEEVKLKITSSEGAEFRFTALVYSRSPVGHIKSTPTSLITNMVKGQSVIREFVIQNVGLGETGLVTVQLPKVPWMKLVNRDTLASIAPGSSAAFSLRLTPTADLPLNMPVTGNFVIKCANANTISVPFSIEPVSESFGSLLVDVVDEYTYNTPSAPHVDSAHVILRHPYTGAVVAEGYTGASGTFLIEDIPEGFYTLRVSAKQRDNYQNTVYVEQGKVNNVLVFISYQAISYTWDVVPTWIEDEYEINLIVEFETNVPLPVVVIDMPTEMPRLEHGEFYPFVITLTNKGLITAKEVQISLPQDDAEYVFKCMIEEVDLLANQSIQVPVIMERRSSFKSEGLKSEGRNDCWDIAGVSYKYECGPHTNYKYEKKYFKYTWRICSGNGVSAAYLSGIFPSPGPGGGPGGGTGPGPSASVPVASVREDCAPCFRDIYGYLNALNTVAGCLCTFSPGKSCEEFDEDKIAIVIPAAIVAKIITFCKAHGVFSCVLGAGTDCQSPFSIKCFKSVMSCINVKLSNPYIGILTCLYDIMNLCQEADKSGNPGFLDEAQQMADLALMQIFAARNWAYEIYNDSVWFEAEPMELALFDTYFDSLEPDQGVTLTDELIEAKPTNVSLDQLQAFVSRWNNTVAMIDGKAYDASNVMDAEKIMQYVSTIDSCTFQASVRGYGSVADMVVDIPNILEAGVAQEKGSVCAKVTLNFSQTLTMTREAFEGTLTLFNGHETEALEEVRLDLIIKDENGDVANHLFQINTLSVDKLTEIDGSGLLQALQTGTAVVQFIPTKNAAPTLPKTYYFGGVLSYMDPFTNEKVSTYLFPVALQVNPSPDLYLTYFMQRNIFGDDPLTEKVEPIIPAELAVMINNLGAGEARNVQLSSAQPEIIDNEKGLMIEFQIIGSSLSGESVQLGLNNIDFGNIAGGDIKIGQWWFTSTLLGHFVSYKATVKHLDSYGNPDLSLIGGVEIHELIKSISAYGPLDDGIDDFLVNAIPDAMDAPDMIYFSQGTTADVYQALLASVDAPLTPGDTTVVLSLTPRAAGWSYARLDDPGDGLYRIVSVTRDDGQEIPLKNVWLTHCTLPDGGEPIYENKLHIVDVFDEIAPANYTIVFEMLEQNLPAVIAIRGIPESIADKPLEQIQVVFNKPINPATFTYEDISLRRQGGANLSDATLAITQVSDTIFTVDISDKTNASGYYVLVVQAANIQDWQGNSGIDGVQVSWIQAFNIPAIRMFVGLPYPAGPPIDTLLVMFNMPILPNTFTPEQLLLRIVDGADIPVDRLVITPANSTGNLYKLSGLLPLNLSENIYEITVKVTEIVGVNGEPGMVDQSVKWVIDQPIVLAVDAGPDRAICELDIPQLTGTALNHSRVMWSTSGSGFFSEATILNPVYFPSAEDIEVGQVRLCLAATGVVESLVLTDCFTLTINKLPTVACPADMEICCDAAPVILTGGLPEGGVYSGRGVSYNAAGRHYMFTPSCSDTGEFLIDYQFTDGNGCVKTCQFIITVHPLPVISCAQDIEVCCDADPFILQGAQPEGGIYSGEGVSFDPEAKVYLFTPSCDISGDFPITYTYVDDHGCENYCLFTVRVHALPVMAAPVDFALCCDALPVVLTGALPEGGIYSGRGVVYVADEDNYVFTPSCQDPGDIQITYTYADGNGCANSCEFTITVHPLPVLTHPTQIGVCVDQPIFILQLAEPAGGLYSGRAVSQEGSDFVFDPGLAGVGDHLIDYAYTDGNGCSSLSSFIITVHPLPVMNCPEDLAVCIDDDTFVLDGATPPGGKYTGQGVLAMDAAYAFDPAVAGAGDYQIVYTYTDEHACVNTCSFTITVHPLPVVVCPSAFAICCDADPVVLSGAIPEGGIYSGHGVTYAQETGEYLFTPSCDQTGQFTITYTYTDGNTCSNSCNFVITVFDLPLMVCPAELTVCIDAPAFVLPEALPLGGVCQGEAVLDDAGRFMFDPGLAGAGTHLVTYHYTDANGCSNTCSFLVTVNPLPEMECPEDMAVCVDMEPFVLSMARPLGGWYGGRGVVAEDNEFFFDPALAGVGQHTVTYTFTDAHGCINSCSFSITVYPLPVMTSPEDMFLCCDADPAVLTGATPEGGVYQGEGVSYEKETGAYLFTPSCHDSGMFEIQYTYIDTNACVGTCSFTITVHPLPEMVCPDDIAVCIDDEAFVLLEAVPEGGIYSGPGLIDEAAIATFSPTLAGEGMHTMTYTFTDENGCTNACHFTVIVSRLAVVTTLQPANITEFTATLGVQVLAEGCAPVTSRGVVWGTEELPDMETHEGMDSEGEGTGFFRTDVSGLTPDTTYYVRAFAISEEGVAYGQQLQFRTLKQYFMVNLQAEPEEGGTLTGGGMWAVKDTVRVEAVAVDDYLFVEWSGDVQHIDNPQLPAFDFIMPVTNVFFVAHFEEIPKYSVVFNVNMTYVTPFYAGFAFEPATDVVHVTGSMLDWAMPGSMPEAQTMAPDELNPLIYTVSMILREGAYEYKYFLNNGWNGGEWQGGNNRNFELYEDLVLDDWFGVLNDPTITDESDSNSDIRIFPNPVRNLLHIVASSEIREIRIFSLSGDLLLSETPDSSVASINMRGQIPPGVYVIQVITSTGFKVQRMLVM